MGWRAKRDAYRSAIISEVQRQQERLARGQYWGALGYRTLREGEVGVRQLSFQDSESGERIRTDG